MTYARCVTEVPIKTDYFLHQLLSLELKYCFFYEERIHKTHTHTHRKQVTCISFYHGATAPVGQGLLIIEDSWSHSDTPHSVEYTGRVIRPTQRPLPDKTQHSQETDMHAPGGIRTHNPSKRGIADPRLSPRGHWDWQVTCMYTDYTLIGTTHWVNMNQS